MSSQLRQTKQRLLHHKLMKELLTEPKVILNHFDYFESKCHDCYLGVCNENKYCGDYNITEMFGKKVLVHKNKGGRRDTIWELK